MTFAGHDVDLAAASARDKKPHQPRGSFPHGARSTRREAIPGFAKVHVIFEHQRAVVALRQSVTRNVAMRGPDRRFDMPAPPRPIERHPATRPGGQPEMRRRLPRAVVFFLQ